jgi:uncharacterized OsmC-like protein
MRNCTNSKQFDSITIELYNPANQSFLKPSFFLTCPFQVRPTHPRRGSKLRVEVRYTNHLQFQATARGHEILSDQPLDNGGDDTGMTPPEWFLASLGSCVGFYAVKYLQTRGLEAAGLSIHVSAQKTMDSSARLDDIEIHLSLPIVLDNHHQQGLRKAVDVCIIHNTLMHPPRVTTQIVHTVSEITG